MMPRPWDLSAQDHAVIADVPEDQRALLTQQLIQSNHNCYLVAFEAACVSIIFLNSLGLC